MTKLLIWDWAATYPPGVVWNGAAPQLLYSGRPVVEPQRTSTQH